MTSKSQVIKAKICKRDYIKLKLLHSKGNSQKNEMATYRMGENIKHISDQRLIFKIYNKFLQLNSKKNK